jgi:hypothetical protein
LGLKRFLINDAKGYAKKQERPNLQEVRIGETKQKKSLNMAVQFCRHDDKTEFWASGYSTKIEYVDNSERRGCRQKFYITLQLLCG